MKTKAARYIKDMRSSLLIDAPSKDVVTAKSVIFGQRDGREVVIKLAIDDGFPNRV